MTHKVIGLVFVAIVCWMIRDLPISYDMIWVGACIIIAGFMSGGEKQ